MQQEIIAEACSRTFRYCWPSRQVSTYRFLVDGEWRCIPDLPNITNESGHVVNLLDVHDCLKMQNVAQNLIHPPSPTVSFGWIVLMTKRCQRTPNSATSASKRLPRVPPLR